MTTIAYDGLAVAADRQSTFGSTPVACVTPKLHRLTFESEEAIVGACGAISSFAPAVEWLRNRKKPRPQFVPSGDPDFSIMVVTKSGRVLYAAGDLQFVELPKRHAWAIGSGCDYALGAMMAGANAHDAVLIAGKLDTGTGMGIDVEDFQH